jgi:3'-phosphoadenosine 5'-phosphosulfate (PAPS) 3'-phosphatase
MQPYEERATYEYFWCVDPLDGTKVCHAATALSHAVP